MSDVSSAPDTALTLPSPPTQASTLKRLRALAAAVPEAADLVLLGDSLAAGWPAADLPSDRSVFNFGLPGERMQNTLWRLETVQTAHLRPRNVVLLLGTNNLGDGDAPEAIAAGLGAVVAAISRVWSGPHILLLTIPRRGELPGFREADRLSLNQTLAERFATTDKVEVIDADPVLAERDDDPEPSLDPDLLHISEAGYRRLGHALAERLARSEAISAPGSAAPADCR